jgi:hypothetical protein
VSGTTCGGCDVRWHQRGNQTGHCSGCHRTFQGVSTFDAHQRLVDGRSVCLDPQDILTGGNGVHAGEPRFKAIIDTEGAQVWRSAAQRPEGSWAT